jgi:tripartite-type tricarboxylate transporter receptor subunit TctC
MKMKMHLLAVSLIGLALFNGTFQTLHANEFYQAKTIRFVVGFAAGGGYDLSARIVGRHMGKHIPGHPTIVVENMTGPGSLIAANYTYNSAKPDGLFVGIWNSVLVAMRRKEVDGGCWTWESARTTARPMLGCKWR